MQHDDIDIDELLASRGLRLTRQRRHLAGLLFKDSDRHVTAEMLAREAKQKKRSRTVSGLATVYNTLHQFCR